MLAVKRVWHKGKREMKMKKFKQFIPLISLMVLLSVGGTAQGGEG